MYLVFIWLPWAGKGTLARILKREYWFDIFETWQILREKSRENTELWAKIKSIIDKWNQVSPEIIEELLVNFINKVKNPNIVFDGLVRNLQNKKTADKILGKEYKVVYFDTKDDIVIKRLLWRMYNPRTGETFPAWTVVDPFTGEKLVKREDDKIEYIIQRIKDFYQKTYPVIQEYEKENRIIKINASAKVEKVKEELIKKIL